MSPPKTDEVVRDRQNRFDTTEDAAVFVAWASAKLHVYKNELMEIALAALQEKLSEYCDDVPAIDVGDFDFDSLLE